ncbi:MAG: hypothetical protein Q9181_005060 [Wetmoreana brouardii]
MAHSSSSASPIPSIDGTSTPSPVIPTLQTRRAACTHLTMERLYGDYECNVCHRPSAWGWLYVCTQDERTDEAVASRDSIPSKPAWTADLSPWIQKAIAEGQYTGEQVEKLVAQRQKVLDTIAASQAHFKKTQAASTRTSFRSSVSASTSNSTSGDTNPSMPFPLITEISGSTPDAKRGSLATSGSTKSRIFPVCRYRACQHCRPTYRDRTWQVLDEAFATKVGIPDIDDNNPDLPVSNLKLLQTFGIRKAKKKSRRPPLRSFDSMGPYDADDEGWPGLKKDGSAQRSISANGLSADLADQKTSETDTKGFRDSVRRAFKGMLISTRKRESWSSKYGKKSTETGDFLQHDGAEVDLGLWKELSEELLQEAAGIPLPGHDAEDGVEMEEDEVEVEDGVAVTEEAVVTGTADIIMSV